MSNEFETMCKRLSKYKRGCGDKQYACAEKAVIEYVGKDRKKLLQIKAQAEAGDFYSYSALLLGLVAVVISLVDALLGASNIMIKIILLGTPGLCIIALILKYIHVLKWRSYILVAISEVEREWK